MRRLRRGKAQVGRAQFGQLAAGTEPSQRERWILAGGDHQMHLRWQVLQQKGEGEVNWPGINDVVVVKDEEMVRDGAYFIEQGRQNRFGWRWLRGLEHIHHACANTRRNRLQRSHEVGQKARGVVLPFVQRQPGHPIVDSPKGTRFWIVDCIAVDRGRDQIVNRKS